MDSRTRQDSVVDSRRVTIGAGFVLAVIAALIARLWYLQIYRGEDFRIASERNRLREVPQPAPRGLIYNRDAGLMLSNRPFFDLVIVPQYLIEKERTFEILSGLFHIAPEVIEKKLEKSASLPRFAPVEIKKNLTLHEVALVESVRFFLPGVDVEIKPRRAYSRNESAHLFGYLDEITGRELDNFRSRFPEGDYESQSTVGKLGVEKKYETYLRGRKGLEYLQVDAYGRLQSGRGFDLGGFQGRAPTRGNDLYLTIDGVLQNAAIEAFKNKNGALVALDPRSGEILAYVSNPNFSLSMFQDGLTSEDWQALQSNPFKPLLDKVTGGSYPPASTYKVVTAIAALEEGVVTPGRVFNCDGTFRLGNGLWRCHKRTGHGPVNLFSAMAMSCDVWFYQVGNLVGVDKIAKWAKLLGFGERTGLDLNMELPGLVPTSSWKLRERGIPWQQGDTINIAIGQGYNLATPLQLANAYAAIANGGTLYRPFLLRQIVDESGQVKERSSPKVIRKVPLQPWVVEAVQKSLRDVVDSPNGTARRIQSAQFSMAGKTGTAQNASLKRTKDIENIQLLQRDHAWFAAYSPAEDPRIVVVVLSEYDGGGGGSQAAPIAREVIEAFWRKQEPSRFSSVDASSSLGRGRVSPQQSQIGTGSRARPPSAAPEQDPNATTVDEGAGEGLPETDTLGSEE